MNKLHLSWLLPVAAVLGLGACGDTRLCKSGTLFVTIDFQGAALAADNLLVAVTPDGDPPRQNVFPHAPGTATGSIEIDFPAGYQVGRHVQIVLTAQKAGADVATVTGSVVLAAGCSTLSIRVGGGSNDGGGTDLPAGTGGVPGADGGPGTGGTTGTGGSPGTDGGGSGGRIDGGNDVACVFQSAEDCFNGIDDDCNGHTDCDDPACVPSTSCVPAAGANGFVPGAYVDPAVGCPARFGAGETGINATLVPGAGCTGCSCTSSMSCSTNLFKYASAVNCGLGLTPALAGSITSSYSTGAVGPTASCLVSTFTATTNAGVGTYVVTNGPCVPQGTPVRSTPTWTTSRKFCSAGSVGAGCSQGYVCVPKAAPNHCVLALGAKTCPAGYTKDGGSWYTGFSDTRTCSACTCGTQTAGSCANLQANFYFGTSTTCNAGTHRAGGSGANVCTFSNDCASAGFQGTPTLPSCPGVSAVTGAATPTGEQTLCCF